jgi:glutamate-ammonia-ligase adenylyltransferase
MALNNWERFNHSLGSPEFHYNVLLSQPMHLEILLSIFSTSQFLSDTLIRNPGFLDWVIIPEMLRKPRRKEELEEELRKAANGCKSHGEWLNRLRRLRRREILRIGTRDIVLGVSTREIMGDLSNIAEAFTQVALDRAWEKLLNGEKVDGEMHRVKSHFCIMSLGKLGGNELNYSSDIDLLGLWSGRAISKGRTGYDKGFHRELFTRVMENVRSDLSAHTEEGYAYRVDLRLRPFGSAGELVPTVSGLLDYYRDRASIWEIQAALKMRPLAGSLRLGYDFMEQMRSILLKPRSRDDVVESIEKMRSAALKPYLSSHESTIDVKNGIGGLRDVEFLVQGLQLIHAPNSPELLEGNTMMAIEALCEARILPEETAEQLKQDYTLLRHTEHYLQILEDRQIHTIPKDSDELDTLAKRILGIEGSAEQFREMLNGCLKRIRKAYVSYLLEG